MQDITEFYRPREILWGPYLFGTELELLTKSKSSTNVMRWSGLVEHLADESKKEVVHAEVVEGTTEWNFRKWAITGDGSILQNREAGEMGIELIAPLCTTIPLSEKSILNPVKALDASEQMWKIVTNVVDVIDVGPNYESCGTHVHISTREFDRFGWQPFEHFKRLARAVVYFERCIDSLMPPHRHVNKWCRSNRYNAKLKALDTPQALAKIEELSKDRDGFQCLTDIMCPPLENGNRRSYRWNFMNLVHENPKRRTVEFRQPPGATTVFRTTVWTQFAVAFFAGAAAYDYGVKGDPKGYLTIDPSKPATFERLDLVLAIGCHLTKIAQLGTLRVLFENKCKLDDGPWEEEIFGADDESRIRAKEKNSEIVSNGMEAGLEEIERDPLPFAEEL